MTLPTNYVTGDTIDADSDNEGGGGVNAWTAAINANTNYLNGTTSGPTLLDPTISGYTETVQALGTVGSTKTIGALTAGTCVTATLTASTATTFTMPTAVAGQSFILILKQPSSTGNGSATFTGVKWNSSGAPTITTAAGKADILSFVSDGTDWYGSYSQGYTY